MERPTAEDRSGAEPSSAGGATTLDDIAPGETRFVRPGPAAIVFDDPTLGLTERILLGTDANVVRLLEVCFHESICTAQLSQVCTPVLPTDAELELTGDERILRRKTLLQGTRTGRTYVYAESAIVLDRLERGMAEALLSTSETIGHLLLADRAETFRELVRVGRMQAGPLGDRFGLDGDDELSCRTYRIVMGGRPAMLITEYLPPFTAAPEEDRPAEAGNDVMVTSRGKPVAKITSPHDPLAELRRHGLVSEPVRPKRPSRDRPLIAAAGNVSDLVADQRR